MSKKLKVLVTAGPVYGRLDDNKLVSNRSRGIWAEKFAEYLMRHGHDVTLLLADNQTRLTGEVLGAKATLTVQTHSGFLDYREKCHQMATTHDAAVMAAAVVNWIPAAPVKGKMVTKGYQEGDIIQVPFMLAPHVINEMKGINPRLTLIGCKMLVEAAEADLIEAAYGVLLKAKCNAVVANDLGHGLKRKLVVNQDRTVQVYDNDFDGLFENLRAHIEDEHYHTEMLDEPWPLPRPSIHQILANPEYQDIFADVLRLYRPRFIRRRATGPEFVLGAICVPWTNGDQTIFQVSSREKIADFGSQDSVVVMGIEGHTIKAIGPDKPTLNAPLLARVAQKYGKAVLHLHEQLPDVPTVPYAPPGTVRDNEREIPGPVFNIEGHGFIACLDDEYDIWMEGAA